MTTITAGMGTVDKMLALFTVIRLGKEAIERSVCDNLVGSAVPKEPSETCSAPKRQYAVDMPLVDRQWYQNAITFILSM